MRTESEHVEFKKSLSELKDGVISLTAMLNKHGSGELWFGIRPDGQPEGLNITEKTLRDVSQVIAAHIEPKIYPVISAEVLLGKPCLKVVAEGNEQPYFAYGRAYMRVADEDRQLSSKELQNLILLRNQEKMRWELETIPYSADDLDENRLQKFVSQAGLNWTDPVNVLENLNLLDKQRLCKAGVLFFDKNPMIKLRCAVFGGTSTAFIIDRHDFEGDILTLIEEAQKYILKNIHIGMRLNGLYREDVPEIALVALREAIINAFCHRDYRDPDHVQVAIFHDRVEVRSPGGLVPGFSMVELRQGGVSRRRNQLIADLLRRIHLVESWGRGIPLILHEVPDAEFFERAGLFITSFKRPSFLSKATTQKPEITTEKTTEKLNSATNTTTKKTTEKQMLSDIETRVERLILENPTITQKELAQQLGLTEDGIWYHIDRLKAKNRLRRIGGRKAGRWEIVKESSE